MLPIREDEPSGDSLRYDRIFDQIAEARAEEDETLPTGNWERQAKRADVSQVISLTCETLQNRSKDLWLAAWLGEASIRQEKWKALPESLNLLLRLQEEFWDSLYPEVEEGDLGLRIAPLQWAMTRYAALVYELPVTVEAFGFHVYQAARAIGYQADADQDEVARAARAAAIEQGKLTPEDLDVALAATSKSFYVSLVALFTETSEVLQNLHSFCEARYGDDGPSLVKIRTAVDEVGNLALSLLRKKRELDPDPASNKPEPDDASKQSEQQDRLDEIPPQDEAILSLVDAGTAEADLVPLPEKSTPETTAGSGDSSAFFQYDSWDSAVAQVQRCADFMFTQRPDHPAPYLLLNSLMSSDAMTGLRVAAPSSETRLLLKQTSEEGDWTGLLQKTMTALATPFGTEWLDLHHYLWLASTELGYETLADCARDHVRAMYRRFGAPLIGLVFEDDTPTANSGTLQWLQRDVLDIAESETRAETSLQAADTEESPWSSEQELFVLANEWAASGDLQKALRVLTGDTIAANGRILFQRKLEVARLCLEAGQSLVAEPLLRRLLDEADERHLAHWEGHGMVGSVLTLLLRSTDANGTRNEVPEENRSSIFARLCAIDAVAALAHATSVQHE
ncbi:type VI secretion system protein TssA [Terriglobus saanensis]|nr:type VI secretion system protein TssA [Terriglobus saanensis]